MALCPRHSEPLRKTWPVGYAQVVMKLLRIVPEDPRVVEFCTKPGEKLADASLLTAAFIKFSPLCCFIGEKWPAVIHEAVD